MITPRQEFLYNLERFDRELTSVLLKTKLRISADNGIFAVYDPYYRSRVIVASTQEIPTDTEAMSVESAGWEDIYEYLEDGDSWYFRTEELEPGRLKYDLIQGEVTSAVVSPVYDLETNTLLGYVGYSWSKGSKPNQLTITSYSERSAQEISRLIQTL